MAVIKRLLAVPVRFGGEEHSGWLPANAATPQPTPVEDTLVDLCGAFLDGIVICPSENGHLTYTLSLGGRVCYLRNASGRRE